MDDETTQLYQELILDHDARPRNYGLPASSTHVAPCYNPLCGDSYRLHLTIVDGRVRSAAFEGNGCAISRASLSMMTSLISGITTTEARQLFFTFRDALLSEGVTLDGRMEELQALTVVRHAPTRVKCALLGWEALYQKLASEDAP